MLRGNASINKVNVVHNVADVVYNVKEILKPLNFNPSIVEFNHAQELEKNGNSQADVIQNGNKNWIVV